MSQVTKVFGIAAIAMSTNIYAVNPNSGQTSTSRTLNIEIASPADLADVDIASPLTVDGRVNIGALPSTGRSNVAYVLDVSFSTSFSINDCNNDGTIDAGDDFSPADDDVGTTLGCEAGAVMALNDNLGSNSSVSTAIALFGSRSATAQNFVTPPNSDSNSNGVSDSMLID